MRRVHRPLDPVEPVAQRPVVHLGRRRHVRSEEAHVEPAEAAQGPEALALPPNGVDRRVPVHANAEAPRLEPPDVRADTEADRHCFERVRPRLQGTFCLVRRLPADVDARDANAVCEPCGRA